MTRSAVDQKDDPSSSDGSLRDEIDTLIKSSRMGIALDAIDRALETHPDDAQFLLRRGKVLRFLNRLPESATILQDLLKRAPDDHQIICELAATTRRLGDIEGSLALVLPVLEEDPNNESARFEQIEALLARGEGQAALSAARAGQAAAPESIDMSLIQARALQMAGQDEAAVAELQDLRTARPANPFVGFALAQALHYTGAFEEEDEVYAELTASVPNFIRSWAGRIDLALEDDQTEAAAQICDEALIHNAGNRTLILLKCRVLQALQRLDSAIELIEEALEQMPADEVLQTRLVQLLYLTGNPDIEPCASLYAHGQSSGGH
ncbi:MAG: tetratricopeptide repeat protein [Octadecabacter sp.]|nr:tetratricopeptide repeat protein [Octadecabacter sp.]